jgi:oligopeptidase B
MSSNPSRTLAPVLAPIGNPRENPGIETLAPAGQEEASPPVARIVPRVETVHGDIRVDDYFWLRDRSDPEVIGYLEAENRYTGAVMRHTERLQECLYQEMRSRIKETDLSVPERVDDYIYYTRTETGHQYPIFCRRRGSVDGPEEILLDQNPLAAGHPYFRLGANQVSPDHRLLAYSVDTSGAEEFTLFIKNLTTGELLAESIPRTSHGVQ